MAANKIGDFTGYSEAGIGEAILDALQKAGEHTNYEVIETRGSHISENKRHYQVIIATYKESNKETQAKAKSIVKETALSE